MVLSFRVSGEAILGTQRYINAIPQRDTSTRYLNAIHQRDTSTRLKMMMMAMIDDAMTDDD